MLIKHRASPPLPIGDTHPGHGDDHADRRAARDQPSVSGTQAKMIIRSTADAIQNDPVPTKRIMALAVG